MSTSGDANTFGFVGGELTYYGDSTTEPELDFSLTTADDSLVEGDESFPVKLANQSGTVTPIPPTVMIGDAMVTTLIKDNDKVTRNIASGDGSRRHVAWQHHDGQSDRQLHLRRRWIDVVHDLIGQRMPIQNNDARQKFFAKRFKPLSPFKQFEYARVSLSRSIKRWNC